MNTKTLFLISLSFSITNVAFAKNNLQISRSRNSWKASTSLKTKKPHKDVKCSCVVVQTINNEQNTCYQIIETRDSPQGKPSFDMLTNANSFYRINKKFVSLCRIIFVVKLPKKNPCSLPWLKAPIAVTSMAFCC